MNIVNRVVNIKDVFSEKSNFQYLLFFNNLWHYYLITNNRKIQVFW